MNEHVHDPRHRFSYELRPDPQLDARLRAVAVELELLDLIAPGASTAPRFQPHLTLCRAAALDERAVTRAAATVGAAGAHVTFDVVDAFGGGRIVYLALADPSLVGAARAAIVDRIDPDDLDPLATARPWTPHVTVAYAVPAAARDAALEVVWQAMPIHGHWAGVQGWDLDVRPTVLAFEAPCVVTRHDG